MSGGEAMKNKSMLIAAAILVALIGFSLPAEAHGFRFSFGVSFGFGGGYYYPYGRPWYGPAYYPGGYFGYAYVPYRPGTVMRYYRPYTVYRSYPVRNGHYRHDYGRYVPRRYTRGIYGPGYR
jgi:hypothetical protein